MVRNGRNSPFQKTIVFWLFVCFLAVKLKGYQPEFFAH